MKSHASPGYRNPFLRVAKGIEDEHVHTRQSDVFYRDEKLSAFIAVGRPPNVPFSTLVISNEPYENLYEIPEELLCAVHVFTKRLALALKQVLACDGVTIRQHNESAGGQDVWHYHVHVVPRFTGDLFHEEAWHPVQTTPEERAPWADKLKQVLDADRK
jgi:histidine triad (HIT) family protein